MRSQNSNNIRTRRTNQTGQKNKTNLYMVVPCHQGLSERIKRSCNKFGVQVFFKGGQTIRNLLMAPNININNFTIVGREDQNLTRAIKEALFIRVNDPSLNRNIGKYHLPHIWDEVLHTTSELKLNWPSGHSIKPPWQQHLPSHPWVDITSTTKAITSAYCICGNNISHWQ